MLAGYNRIVNASAPLSQAEIAQNEKNRNIQRLRSELDEVLRGIKLLSDGSGPRSQSTGRRGRSVSADPEGDREIQLDDLQKRQRQLQQELDKLLSNTSTTSILFPQHGTSSGGDMGLVVAGTAPSSRNKRFPVSTDATLDLNGNDDDALAALTKRVRDAAPLATEISRNVGAEDTDTAALQMPHSPQAGDAARSSAPAPYPHSSPVPPTSTPPASRHGSRLKVQDAATKAQPASRSLTGGSAAAAAAAAAATTIPRAAPQATEISRNVGAEGTDTAALQMPHSPQAGDAARSSAPAPYSHISPVTPIAGPLTAVATPEKNRFGLDDDRCDEKAREQSLLPTDGVHAVAPSTTHTNDGIKALDAAEQSRVARSELDDAEFATEQSRVARSVSTVSGPSSAGSSCTIATQTEDQEIPNGTANQTNAAPPHNPAVSQWWAKIATAASEWLAETLIAASEWWAKASTSASKWWTALWGEPPTDTSTTDDQIQKALRTRGATTHNKSASGRSTPRQETAPNFDGNKPITSPRKAANTNYGWYERKSSPRRDAEAQNTHDATQTMWTMRTPAEQNALVWLISHQDKKPHMSSWQKQQIDQTLRSLKQQSVLAGDATNGYTIKDASFDEWLLNNPDEIIKVQVRIERERKANLPTTQPRSRAHPQRTAASARVGVA